MSNKPGVLVIGGGGYIGSCIVETLLKKSYFVRVYDKFLFGKHTLSDLLNGGDLEIIQGDICQIINFKRAFQNIQTVIHLAGIVGDKACEANRKLTIETNILATKIIKDISKRYRNTKFIYISSCSVYGESSGLVHESDRIHAFSLYAQTKIESEKILLSDNDATFHPTILRLGTVFGHSRRARFDLVVNSFTAQAYYNGIISIQGGRQWRPFIHISDVVRAILSVIQAPFHKINRQIFNVSNDSLNIQIAHIAHQVRQVIRKDRNNREVIERMIGDSDDRRSYIVSTSKIKRSLRYRAEKDLYYGIKEIYFNCLNNKYSADFHRYPYVNQE